jgi:hypothetical protein
VERLSLQRVELANAKFVAITESTRSATAALDKRLESMNEFRQQINDMASKFITRSDVESSLKYINENIAANDDSINKCVTRQEMTATQTATNERLSSLEKFSNNTQGRMWVIAAVVVVLELAMHFLQK